jgi:hypothetical protein
MLLCPGNFNIVVVEGCPKSLKRYHKLMLRRIDWNATPAPQPGEDEEDVADVVSAGGGEDGKPFNSCHLVWEVRRARMLNNTQHGLTGRMYFVVQCEGHMHQMLVGGQLICTSTRTFCSLPICLTFCTILYRSTDNNSTHLLVTQQVCVFLCITYTTYACNRHHVTLLTYRKSSNSMTHNIISSLTLCRCVLLGSG